MQIAKYAKISQNTTKRLQQRPAIAVCASRVQKNIRNNSISDTGSGACSGQRSTQIQKLREKSLRYEKEARPASRAKYLANPENKEKMKRTAREYVMSRYRTDSEYNLRVRLRSRAQKIKKALKGQGRVRQATLEYLGCSISELHLWVQSNFMAWDNLKQWHIDHVVPVAAFDLTDEKQVRFCYHWTNLQPLWRRDNIQKSDSVDIGAIHKFLDILKDFAQMHDFAKSGYEIATERLQWLKNKLEVS